MQKLGSTENNIQQEYTIFSLKFLTAEFFNSVELKKKRFYLVVVTCWSSDPEAVMV